MELFIGKWKWQRDEYHRTHPHVLVCYTAEQAVMYLQQRPMTWDVVHIGADLGEVRIDRFENTGLAIAKWMVQARPNIKSIKVYATIRQAARPILDILHQAGYEAAQVRFSKEKDV